MKIRLLKVLHVFAVLLTVSIITLLTLFCFIWAELPALTSETPRIEAYLSQKLNASVSMESISLDFRGLHPVISIHQLAIYTKDHTKKLFSANVLSAGLHYIYVENTSVNFIKDASEHWQLENLSILMPEVPVVSWVFSRKMVLEGRDINVGFTSAFPKPIYLEHVRLRGLFEKNAEGLSINASRVLAENEDISVHGSAKISPELWNINVKYKLGAEVGAHLSNYLPMNLLSPPLLHWLTSSIKKVGGGEGIFLLSGNPKDFPYEVKPGKFLIDANLSGITLDYAPLWPIAEKLSGELIFDRDSMQMNVFSADLLKTTVRNVKAKIPVLGEKAVLTLQGSVSSNAQNMLAFVLQSPLKKKLGQYLEGMHVDGNANLALTLNLPLSEKAGNTILNAEVNVDKNIVKLPNDMVFDNVKGQLTFNENGLTGNKLTANFSNDPLSVDVKPENYKIDYGKWHIQVNPLRDSWQLNIVHPALTGILNVGSHEVRGALQKLYADQFSSQAEKKSLSPEKLPAFNVNINDFRYKDKNFGQTTLITTPGSDGLNLNKLQANLGGTAINATGYWKKNNHAGITGAVVSRNAQEMLKNWGINSGLDSQSVSLNGQLSWQGKLYSPDIATLQGKVGLTVGKGQILNMGSQAKMDFGRLLTLLSFHSLAQRLKLDFTDLTSRGLSFDSIKGDFVLNNGVASTENMTIQSPIANILITGSINLLNQTYQLKAVVTPDLTSSLPIIATIAGGPVAGAAVWAANKVISPVINKITSDNYTVTGTWDKPIIQ